MVTNNLTTQRLNFNGSAAYLISDPATGFDLLGGYLYINNAGNDAFYVLGNSIFRGPVKSDKATLAIIGGTTGITNMTNISMKLSDTIIYRQAANECMGSGNMSAGRLSVSTACFIYNTGRVFITVQSPNGTVGTVMVNGTGNGIFNITSTSATDTSEVAWFIFNKG